MEIWKDIPGYKGIYQVNQFSIVRSVDHKVKRKDGKTRIQHGRILKTTVCKKGYVQVSLSRNGKRLHTGAHRLCALVFIPNPKKKPQINHKDCNKKNNFYKNLEWCTNKENHAHSVKNNLQNPNYGENHHMAKLTNRQAIQLRKRIKKGDSISKLSKEYGMSDVAIYNIKNNKTYINI